MPNVLPRVPDQKKITGLLIRRGVAQQAQTAERLNTASSAENSRLIAEHGMCEILGADPHTARCRADMKEETALSHS